MPNKIFNGEKKFQPSVNKAKVIRNPPPPLPEKNKVKGKARITYLVNSRFERFYKKDEKWFKCNSRSYPNCRKFPVFDCPIESSKLVSTFYQKHQRSLP